MVASSFIKIFSIAVLAAFSVSAQGGVKCPQIQANEANDDNIGKKRFIVMFDNGIKNAAADHYEMMKECYNTRVQSIIKDDISIDTASDQSTIRDFSVEGSMQGYTSYFTSEFAKAVGKMENVKLVEEDKEVKVLYAIPQNFSRPHFINRRAEDDHPQPDLDRVDQAKRPLDGKYIYPDQAGQDVNVFIIDSGILLTHDEFGGRAKFGGSFCEGCNENDEFGHGTFVSSIVAGNTLGIARKANLISVRVIDAHNHGTSAGIIEGLSFVADQHKKSNNKNSLANMSLGGVFSQALNDAVSALIEIGIHVVVAAGNDGGDACALSPASTPSAITVGATEDNSDAVADFSDHGKCVDIFAPGSNIKGASIFGNSNYVVESGTSFSAPLVTGTLALLISKNGNKPPAELTGDLINLSTKGVVTNLQAGSPDAFLRTPGP